MAGLLSFCSLNSSWADVSGVALVYRGAGVCDDGCWQAAAESATRMGLQVQFVGPTETDPAIFIGARVWIQPGGWASTVSKKMLPDLKKNLRAFIADGGGYVGYCAGGFLATQEISDRKVPGFGILAGRNSSYQDVDESPTQLKINWNGVERDLYWEGGPYFKVKPTDPVEVIAYYSNGQIASVRGEFGKGRVFVTGLHPEGTEDWRTEAKLTDTDGMDFDLTNEMIEWVTAFH